MSIVFPNWLIDAIDFFVSIEKQMHAYSRGRCKADLVLPFNLYFSDCAIRVLDITGIFFVK